MAEIITKHSGVFEGMGHANTELILMQMKEDGIYQFNELIKGTPPAYGEIYTNIGISFNEVQSTHIYGLLNIS